MMKYGMRPGTLKGELFRLLSEQGNNGLKVSEMARASQVILYEWSLQFIKVKSHLVYCTYIDCFFVKKGYGIEHLQQ